MEFQWSAKSIKWYLEAEKMTTFYSKIAGMAVESIGIGSYALDIGCGPGSLSVELAKYCSIVEAIDKSSQVISTIRERVKRLGLTNIVPKNLSFEKLPPDRGYDAVFLCYVAGMAQGELLEKILRHSNGKTFIVLPAEEIKNDFNIRSLIEKTGMDSSSLKQPCCKDVIMALDKLGVKYSVRIFESEFGQPFCTRDEAMDFLRYYFPEIAAEKRKASKWLSKTLEQRDGEYYLPSTRRSALITIL